MHLIKAVFELHCVQFYWIYCYYSAQNAHGTTQRGAQE